MTKFKFIWPIFISVLILSCKGAEHSNVLSAGENSFLSQDQSLQLDHRIWAVFQDTKGMYWFGSNGKGLYQYDGEELKLITTKDGLVDNTIRGIQEDNIGNVFIETPEGISKYNGESFETLKPISSSFDDWKLAPNDLWFGYNTNDINRYDGASLYTLPLPRKDLKEAFGVDTYGLPFKSNNNSPYAVFGVDKDKDGNIWFGTATAGAFRYDGASFLWFREKELSTLPDGRVPGVRSMIQDSDGYFWLSNFRSKYKIDPNAAKGYTKIKSIDASSALLKGRIGYFNSGLVDRNGDLWMTTYGGGVWNYKDGKLSRIDIMKDGEEVLLVSIFEDNNGVLWLGTDNDGVYRQNGESFEKFKPLSH